MPSDVLLPTTPLEHPLDRSRAYVAFYAGDAVLSRLIRKMSDGRVNHVSLIYFSERWDTWVDHGANARGFYPVALDLANPPKDLHSVWRPPTSLATGMRKNGALLGKPYDWSGLVGMLPVEVAQHTFKRRIQNFMASGGYFCSEAVYTIIGDDKCGEDFKYAIDKSERASTLDPEELLRACERTDGWDLIAWKD